MWKLLLACAVCVSAGAQSAPLPSNYKTVIDNADVLVQRVHYGPYEIVPMHDHPATTTVYVYLSNDQGFTIIHEGAEKPVRRPPSHAGAFRVSPGNFERHSIVNSSDASIDFLRVELKKVPAHTLTEEFRGKAPAEPLTPGVTTEYKVPQLRVDRIVCGDAGTKCTVPADPKPSVLVEIAPVNGGTQTSSAQWLAANTPMTSTSTRPHAQWVRVVPLGQ